MSWHVFLILIVAIVGLVIGFILLFNGWKPFKNEKGEKVPLTTKEKWVVGIMMVTGLLTLVGIFFGLNPPVLKRWRERWNNNRAPANTATR